VDKDARERSDAAREAFLAELALDAKKNASKAGDLKQYHDKSKEKKKLKDSRRSKVVLILSAVVFLFTTRKFIFFYNSLN
jgi:hypothetical protein